jgi:hypothetical protein
MKTRPAEPMKTRPSVDFLVEFRALLDPSILKFEEEELYQNKIT